MLLSLLFASIATAAAAVAPTRATTFSFQLPPATPLPPIPSGGPPQLVHLYNDKEWPVVALLLEPWDYNLQAAANGAPDTAHLQYTWDGKLQMVTGGGTANAYFHPLKGQPGVSDIKFTLDSRRQGIQFGIAQDGELQAVDTSAEGGPPLNYYECWGPAYPYIVVSTHQPAEELVCAPTKLYVYP